MKRYDGWFRLATHLGKGLFETIQTTTVREFELWMVWLSEQWNEPDRTDHYLIQLTTILAQANAKHPGRVKPEQFRLRFSTGSSTPSPEREKVELALSKARWLAVASRSGPRPPGAT